ncbi:MAG: hypothetical protein ABSD21_02555 [Rhizomicrobium sp.]|jgi:hypothetical protein
MITKNDLKSLVGEFAPAIARDQRTRTSIRVGAIGHRNIDDAVRKKLVVTVKEVLNLVRQSAEKALRQPHVRELFADGLDFVVISPLAEGADRLIAQAALAQKYRLGAILPFNVADYEATFDPEDRAKSVTEFRTLLDAAAPPDGYGIFAFDGDATAGPQRDAAFMDCARTVIGWSDILIAILSEDKVRSRTGRSVQEAIDAGVPVILIDPKQPDSFTLRLCADGRKTSSSAHAQRVREFIVSLLTHRQSTSTK